MKSIAVVISLTLMVCIAALGHAQVPQTPPGVKSSFETPAAKVLKVYSTKSGDHRFIAYVVKWKDAEVIVSDPLARSDFKVGDTIKFMAQKVHIEKASPEVFSLNFVLLDLPAAKLNGAEAPELAN